MDSSASTLAFSLPRPRPAPVADVAPLVASDLPRVVAPGDRITSDPQYMRGHGTHLEDGVIVASVAGYVERVNKLVSVQPLKARFAANVGDVVVARVVQLGPKRWRVDTNARQDSVLKLSSVNLPGGVQRRKSEADELQMRSFLQEGDLLSAEVYEFFEDRSISLHTRSLKYGKLRTPGVLLTIPALLLRRCKSQFHSLPMGVDVVLGLNGNVWIAPSSSTSRTAEGGEDAMDVDEVDKDTIYENEFKDVPAQQRETVARVCVVVRILASKFHDVYDTAIVVAYESSLAYSLPDLAAGGTDPDGPWESVVRETRSALDLLR